MTSAPPPLPAAAPRTPQQPPPRPPRRYSCRSRAEQARPRCLCAFEVTTQLPSSVRCAIALCSCAWVQAEWRATHRQYETEPDMRSPEAGGRRDRPNHQITKKAPKKKRRLWLTLTQHPALSFLRAHGGASHRGAAQRARHDAAARAACTGGAGMRVAGIRCPSALRSGVGGAHHRRCRGRALQRWRTTLGPGACVAGLVLCTTAT